MRYLTSISLALIVLMALACTATPAEPTPDIPLLDEETVEALVATYIVESHRHYPSTHPCVSYIIPTEDEPTTKKYVGNDIWVVQLGGVSFCTFTVHDKEARVILPQQDNTAD